MPKRRHSRRGTDAFETGPGQPNSRLPKYRTLPVEWRATPSGKEPVMFRMRDGEPFAFAGLWERWYGPPETRLEEPLETVTIVTTQPNALARLVMWN